mmetsp:Transcript_11674/g.25202  ORF Transcript_11674/g.25202 Transcript_11674/m.25202 type:complete len:504 (-) Transcript_11674:163-1674(-)
MITSLAWTSVALVAATALTAARATGPKSQPTARSSSDSGASHIHNFSFQSGINYELSANIVQEEFCDPNSPSSLSGYFGVEGSKYDTKSSKHYFYWFFERRTNSLLPEDEQPPTVVEKDIPFVIWLNGGPGCSSLLGLLQENGPCLVNDDGQSTTSNPYSWTEAAHVLFLDQPANVGYSYGEGNDINEEMIAEGAYYFLQSFFQSDAGEEYKDLQLFLTGESWAGHYLPAIAQRIWQGNQNVNSTDSTIDLLHLPLSGMAIGNGMIDPEEQMKWYAEMAYKNPHNIKIVDEQGYKAMKAAAISCAKDSHKCKNIANKLRKGFVCQKAANCEEHFFFPLEDKNISVYDISKPCIGPLCEDMTSIETFLNQPSTKKALNVPSEVTWGTCNDIVGRKWSSADREASFAPVVSQLLNAGIHVLIYSGDLDYICNYMGNRAVAEKLTWEYSDEFRSAEDHEWNNGGGLAKSSNGLAFLQVYNAGHMVPQDQPKQALAMITQFLNAEEF